VKENLKFIKTALILFLLLLLLISTIQPAIAGTISRDAVPKKKLLKLDFTSSKNNSATNTNLDTYIDTSAEDKKTAERALLARRDRLESKYAKTEVKVVSNGGDSFDQGDSSSTNTATSSSSLLTSPVKKKAVVFSVLAEVDQTKSLVTHNDGGDLSSLDYAIYPMFSFSELVRLKFGLEGTQNQRDSEKSQLNSAFTNLSTAPLAVSDFFDWSPSVSLSIPVNKDQIDRKSLQASSSLGATVMINQDQLPSNISTGIMFLFGKYFYEYTTTTAGEINTDYSMRQVLYGNVQITKWLSLYGELHHIWQADFNGNGTDGFDSKEEIAISPDVNWSFLVGHTNGGSVFKADGMSNNISLINENSSMMYLGVRAKF
jgi:hypothetical protein